MNIEPFEDYIVVRPLEVKEAKPSGIVLPEKAKNFFKIVTARVEAVGQGRLLECGVRRPMDLKKGDTVLFSMHDTRPYPISETALWRANGQQMPNIIIINIGHILGKVQPPEGVNLQPVESIKFSSED